MSHCEIKLPQYDFFKKQKQKKKHNFKINLYFTILAFPCMYKTKGVVAVDQVSVLFANKCDFGVCTL